MSFYDRLPNTWHDLAYAKTERRVDRESLWRRWSPRALAYGASEWGTVEDFIRRLDSRKREELVLRSPEHSGATPPSPSGSLLFTEDPEESLDAHESAEAASGHGFAHPNHPSWSMPDFAAPGFLPPILRVVLEETDTWSKERWEEALDLESKESGKQDFILAFISRLTCVELLRFNDPSLFHSVKHRHAWRSAIFPGSHSETSSEPVPFSVELFGALIETMNDEGIEEVFGIQRHSAKHGGAEVSSSDNCRYSVRDRDAFVVLVCNLSVDFPGILPELAKLPGLKEEILRPDISSLIVDYAAETTDPLERDFMAPALAWLMINKAQGEPSAGDVRSTPRNKMGDERRWHKIGLSTSVAGVVRFYKNTESDPANQPEEALLRWWMAKASGQPDRKKPEMDSKDRLARLLHLLGELRAFSESWPVERMERFLDAVPYMAPGFFKMEAEALEDTLANKRQQPNGGMSNCHKLTILNTLWDFFPRPKDENKADRWDATWLRFAYRCHPTRWPRELHSFVFGARKAGVKNSEHPTPISLTGVDAWLVKRIGQGWRPSEHALQMAETFCSGGDQKTWRFVRIIIEKALLECLEDDESDDDDSRGNMGAPAGCSPEGSGVTRLEEKKVDLSELAMEAIKEAEDHRIKTGAPKKKKKLRM